MQSTNAVTAKRTVAERLKPVVDPAGWTKEELARTSDWLYALSDREVADLDLAVARVQATGLPLIDVQREDFSLPVLGPALNGMRHDVIDGRGFVLIRGVPVHRYTRLQSAIAFWGMGRYFGEPASQNAKGHLLGHVKDLGDKTLGNPHDRGYQTLEQLPFHSDITDIVGLLCLHAAKAGGDSTIASSITIYNEMLKRAPELVAALTEQIYADRRGEIPAGALPYYKIAPFNYFDGYLTTIWQGGYYRSAQRFAELPPFSPNLLAALDMFGELARELAFAMEFRQGDIQLLHNHVIVHSRTAFENHPEPLPGRHLLRLWLATPDGRPLPPAFFSQDYLPPGQRASGSIIVPGTVLNIPLEAE